MNSEVSSKRKRIKIDQKSVQEALGTVFFASCFFMSFFDRFWSDLGSKKAPQMEPSWVKKRSKKWSKNVMVSKSRPRAPQECPRAPQERPRRPQDCPRVPHERPRSPWEHKNIQTHENTQNVPRRHPELARGASEPPKSGQKRRKAKKYNKIRKR